MSQKALNEIDVEQAVDLEVIDQHDEDTLSGSLIGAELDGHVLRIWIDTEMK